MTKPEALIFLGVDEDDSLDALEEKLFEIKNYLISKPIISKLFHGQINRLNKIQDVEHALGIEFKIPVSSSEAKVEFSQNIISSFSLFEKYKSDWKRNVMNSRAAGEVLFLITDILKVQADYLNIWPIYPGELKGDELISKEVDSMNLLADLKSMGQGGIVNFSDLNRLPKDTAVTLLSEWKRLSLLRQKEQEWKTSSKN